MSRTESSICPGHFVRSASEYDGIVTFDGWIAGVMVHEERLLTP